MIAPTKNTGCYFFFAVPEMIQYNKTLFVWISCWIECFYVSLGIKKILSQIKLCWIACAFWQGLLLRYIRLTFFSPCNIDKSLWAIASELHENVANLAVLNLFYEIGFSGRHLYRYFDWCSYHLYCIKVVIKPINSCSNSCFEWLYVVHAHILWKGNELKWCDARWILFCEFKKCINCDHSSCCYGN